MSETRRPLSGHKFMLMFAVVLSLAFGALGVGATAAWSAGNDVVVFDIDGTLTTDTLSNTPQPGAVQAVKTYQAKGYSVVYLTARWKPVQELYTRAWLALNGFPNLPLYMSSSLLLTDSATIKYKTNALKTIENGAPEVVFAYGDSTTDFKAYGNAGVPKAHVFALKRASKSSCETGVWIECLVNYTGHLPYIEALPPGA